MVSLRTDVCALFTDEPTTLYGTPICSGNWGSERNSLAPWSGFEPTTRRLTEGLASPLFSSKPIPAHQPGKSFDYFCGSSADNMVNAPAVSTPDRFDGGVHLSFPRVPVMNSCTVCACQPVAEIIWRRPWAEAAPAPPPTCPSQTPPLIFAAVPLTMTLFIAATKYYPR